MADQDGPKAVVAADAKPRERSSNYPEPFASRMAGRIKRPLGDLFGLTNFGVNLTTLAARRGVLAAPRPLAPGRAGLHPRGRADSGHRRRRDGAAARHGGRLQGRQRQRPPSGQPHRPRRGVSSRSATAPSATRSATPTTTSAPRWAPTVAGTSSTRTAGRTEAAPVTVEVTRPVSGHDTVGRVVGEEQGIATQHAGSADPAEIGDAASESG